MCKDIMNCNLRIIFSIAGDIDLIIIEKYMLYIASYPVGSEWKWLQKELIYLSTYEDIPLIQTISRWKFENTIFLRAKRNEKTKKCAYAVESLRLTS